jgi:hypothetical protein
MLSTFGVESECVPAGTPIRLTIEMPDVPRATTVKLATSDAVCPRRDDNGWKLDVVVPYGPRDCVMTNTLTNRCAAYGFAERLTYVSALQDAKVTAIDVPRSCGRPNGASCSIEFHLDATQSKQFQDAVNFVNGPKLRLSYR